MSRKNEPLQNLILPSIQNVTDPAPKKALSSRPDFGSLLFVAGCRKLFPSFLWLVRDVQHTRCSCHVFVVLNKIVRAFTL